MSASDMFLWKQSEQAQMYACRGHNVGIKWGWWPLLSFFMNGPTGLTDSQNEDRKDDKGLRSAVRAKYLLLYDSSLHF